MLHEWIKGAFFLKGNGVGHGPNHFYWNPWSLPGICLEPWTRNKLNNAPDHPSQSLEAIRGAFLLLPGSQLYKCYISSEWSNKSNLEQIEMKLININKLKIKNFKLIDLLKK